MIEAVMWVRYLRKWKVEKRSKRQDWSLGLGVPWSTNLNVRASLWENKARYTPELAWNLQTLAIPS